MFLWETAEPDPAQSYHSRRPESGAGIRRFGRRCGRAGRSMRSWGYNAGRIGRNAGAATLPPGGDPPPLPQYTQYTGIVIFMKRLKLLLPFAVKALREPRWGLWAVAHSLGILRQGGIGGLRAAVRRHLLRSMSEYFRWVETYDTLTDAGREEIVARIAALPEKPLISVLMPVFDPPLHLLEAAIRSVQTQIYPHWELCIADDASRDPAVRALLARHAAGDSRIRVVFREENGHISRASNSALELVTGEFVALLDNDDLLPEWALFFVAEAINRHPDAGIVYSDEDKLDTAGHRFNPYFKSDWNPSLFLGHNLISHLGVYRTQLMREVGGFRVGFHGSQDYDLAARCVERLRADQIVHIPRVLYHWRIIPGSTSESIGNKPYALTASEQALNEHLMRQGLAGEVRALPTGSHCVRYAVPASPPLVSIIVPTRNGVELLRTCLESVRDKTQYANYQILIVDNASDDPATLRYMAELAADPRIRVLRDDRPFNFSALNNQAARAADGEVLALLNNDIEVITPDWLDHMVGAAMLADVGAVGARLWYPDNTLQHGGVILSDDDVAVHAHHRLPRGSHGYFSRAELMQDFSAVTAACLVVRKDRFFEVDGMNEVDLAIAYNDIDLCLKLRERGYRNLWTPFADLYHHESVSRGPEDTPEKIARLQREAAYMRQRWAKWLARDPAFSPNLTVVTADFGLAWPPRIEALSSFGHPAANAA